ncbi:MAG: aminoacyl-tRNA deacylase [Gaiellaceae bacterium]
MTQKASSKSLIEELHAAGIAHELLPHPRTLTAAAEAAALGVEPQEVAKTIVLSTPAGFVRAVIPASERLDLRKVRAFLEEPRVELLSEDELEQAYPEFDLGAVPPFGGEHHDRVVVDIRVCERESAVFDAGTHEESVRLPVGDLVAHERALIADICLT